MEVISQKVKGQMLFLLTKRVCADIIFVYVKCVIIKNSKQCKPLTENRRDPLKAP